MTVIGAPREGEGCIVEDFGWMVIVVTFGSNVKPQKDVIGKNA